MRIPHQLLRSVPREVTLTTAGRVLAAIAWAMAVAAVGLSAWLFAQALRARAAETEAVVASAQIVRLGSTRGEHPRWVVTYSYDAGGALHEGRATLGRKDRQRREIGETIQVRYLPERPSTSWVDGYQPGRIPLVVPPLALVGLGLASVAMHLAIRRQRGILSIGRPAIATVKDVKKVSGEHGNTYRATVEYHTLTGGRATRKFDVSKATVAGSELIVLYDPETPARAVKYPLSLVKPAEG